MLTVGSLFSGIGGFELGLERTNGFKTEWQCEIDPFCLKVLAKHWPDVKRFTDIKEMGIEEEIPYVDVICGGFPCQPVSCAGKRKGDGDERWLWPEFYRIVCQVKPQWVLVENVPGLLSANSGRLFAGILRDLVSSGYDAEWNIVSAASVGAPHLRKRVFIVAYTSSERRQQDPRSAFANENENERRETQENNLVECNGKGSRTWSVADSKGGEDWGVLQSRIFRYLGAESQERDATDSENQGFKKSEERGGNEEGFTRPERGRIFSRRPTGTWSIESGFRRMADGVPHRVDRLRSLGNAIVPQCAEYIGQCILDSIFSNRTRQE